MQAQCVFPSDQEHVGLLAFNSAFINIRLHDRKVSLQRPICKKCAFNSLHEMPGE